jgi:hypothetical protein
MAGSPPRVSVVHAELSSQEVGQLVRGSQVSPDSTTLLSQMGVQSPSLLASQPEGQQPSELTQLVMALKTQSAVQEPALPTRVSEVQTLPSLQLEGQLATGSQVSPDSTTALSQTGLQSSSVRLLHPEGQQPSASTQLVMLVYSQLEVQSDGSPSSASEVQALLSSQAAGHVAMGSQTSPVSTAPLSQIGEQSSSVFSLQPKGQQPSASMQLVMPV